MRVLAFWTIGTEAAEVEGTKSLTDMFFRTYRSERAEAFFVVWAWR